MYSSSALAPFPNLSAAKPSVTPESLNLCASCNDDLVPKKSTPSPASALSLAVSDLKLSNIFLRIGLRDSLAANLVSSIFLNLR